MSERNLSNSYLYNPKVRSNHLFKGGPLGRKIQTIEKKLAIMAIKKSHHFIEFFMRIKIVRK